MYIKVPADMTGDRFGRLVIEARVPWREGHYWWLCRCDCGVIKEVRHDNLLRGQTRSCGCLAREVASNRAIHGEHHSRLHRIWSGMRERCRCETSQGFRNYGGRGITITPEWDEFTTFRTWAHANGYRPDLTIERQDNDGNYEPGNCKWATAKEQARNTRRTLRAPDGRLLADIAAEHGIVRDVLYGRLRAGWPIERATTEPLRSRKAGILNGLGHSHAVEAIGALADLLAKPLAEAA